MAEGRTIVVDMDLEKFFDRVNHDILMARLARRIGDKRLLKIIRRFLEAGMMQDGVCVARHEGTPQGGPLSPLLANLLLDDLDKLLERRGHCFCRYADDCNIYVRSKAAGERVLASVTAFLEGKLRLRVNREKSAVAHVEDRKFLGHRLLRGGELGAAPKSEERVKERIRQITRRNRGIEIEEMAGELNSFLTGWIAYFRFAKCKTLLRELDSWIRRKLRCVRLKQLKRTRTIAAFLQSHGVPVRHVRMTAGSNKGWWHLSACPAVNTAMNQTWIESLGLANLSQCMTGINKNRNRRIRKVRPVVWEDGGSNSPSYPIHPAEVVLTNRVSLFSGFAIPLDGLGVILGGNDALLMAFAEHHHGRR